MVLFCSEQRLSEIVSDGRKVAALADDHILKLTSQIESHKARADAAEVNSEAICTALEQKYLTASEECSQLQSSKLQLSRELANVSSELSAAKDEIRKLQQVSFKQQSSLEQSQAEISELKRSKRELLDIVQQKNSGLDERSLSIQTYLSKIVSLTEDRGKLEATVREANAELNRTKSALALCTQEKDILAQRNTWLDNELSTKSKSLNEDRLRFSETEAELKSKLAMIEREKEDLLEKAEKLQSLLKSTEDEVEDKRKELRALKDSSTTEIESLQSEIYTANHLIELHRENCRLATEKAADLEGVVKAMETYTKQREEQLSQQYQKEIQSWEVRAEESGSTILALESELKKKRDEIESLRADPDSSGLAIVRSRRLPPIDPELLTSLHGDTTPPPDLPPGTSKMALATILLKDGFSLTKMYNYYKEAADAWRHEMRERIEAQQFLEQLREEVQDKIGEIEEERVQNRLVMETYQSMQQKLADAEMERQDVQAQIRELKHTVSQKEMWANSLLAELHELQDKVIVLLKKEKSSAPTAFPAADVSVENTVKENVELRLAVHQKSQELHQKEEELQERLSAEVEAKENEHSAIRQQLVEELQKAQEIIKHQKSALDFQRLYLEGTGSRFSMNGNSQLAISPAGAAVVPDTTSAQNELLEQTKEEYQKLREDMNSHLRDLQEEVYRAREDASTARVDRARIESECKFIKEQLDTKTKTIELQRAELESVQQRNVEFSHTLTETQRSLRDVSDALNSSENEVRRLRFEVMLLEQQKGVLTSAEQKASQEVGVLSDKVHHLQAKLDNANHLDQLREVSHAAELKHLQDEVARLQNEWVEGKKELEAERVHTRNVIASREKAHSEAMAKLEAASKALDDARNAANEAQNKSQVLQAQCLELEKQVNMLTTPADRALNAAHNKTLQDLEDAKKAAQISQEELAAAQADLQNYKAIAESNEEAIKNVSQELADFRAEAEKVNGSLAAEKEELARKLQVAEADLAESRQQLADSLAEAEKLVNASKLEVSALKKSEDSLRAQLQLATKEISSLQRDAEIAQKTHHNQILSQGETIKELTLVYDKLQKAETELRTALSRAETAEAAITSERIIWKVDMESLAEKQSQLEAERRGLEEQNRLLLDRLETGTVQETGGAAAEGGEGSLQEIVRFLRRSKETSDAELLLLKQERSRLQRQVEAAVRDADVARSRLQVELQKSRDNVFSEEEFAALKTKIEQLALLRESNVTLREENERNLQTAKKLREKVAALEAEYEPLKAAVRDREFDLEASKKETQSVVEERNRWQKRVTQLLEKYRSVDLEEYERIQKELTACQESLKSTAEEYTAVKSELQTTQSTLAELRNQKESTERQLAEVQRQLAAKQAEVESTEEQLRAEKSAVAEMKSERTRLNNVGLKFKKNFETVAAEKTTLTERLEEITKEKENLIRTADENAKKYEEEKKSREQLAKQLNGEPAPQGNQRSAFLAQLQHLRRENLQLQQQLKVLQQRESLEAKKLAEVAAAVAIVVSEPMEVQAEVPAAEQVQEPAPAVSAMEGVTKEEPDTAPEAAAAPAAPVPHPPAAAAAPFASPAAAAAVPSAPATQTAAQTAPFASAPAVEAEMAAASEQKQSDDGSMAAVPSEADSISAPAPAVPAAAPASPPPAAAAAVPATAPPAAAPAPPAADAEGETKERTLRALLLLNKGKVKPAGGAAAPPVRAEEPVPAAGPAEPIITAAGTTDAPETPVQDNTAAGKRSREEEQEATPAAPEAMAAGSGSGPSTGAEAKRARGEEEGSHRPKLVVAVTSEVKSEAAAMDAETAEKPKVGRPAESPSAARVKRTPGRGRPRGSVRGRGHLMTRASGRGAALRDASVTTVGSQEEEKDAAVGKLPAPTDDEAQ